MKKKTKVWILDDEGLSHEKEFEIYEQHHIEYRVTTKASFEKDLKEFGKEAIAVVCQVGFPIDSELINELTNCKVICSFGMGFNQIDLQAATDKNIYVCNVPDYCAEEVADHTLALSLSLLRRLFHYNKNVKNGIWDPTDTEPIHRLSNIVIGLLGFGQIARNVAQKFKAFGVTIIAYDKFVDDKVFEEYGVTRVSFEELLERSNLLSLHVPLTDETRNMLNYEQLKKLPKGAFVVNTCRGGVIVEDDLVKLIKEKHISGAGLDVLLSEPPEKDHELLQLDEVIITPHAAYFSIEAEEQMQRETAWNVVRVVQNETPKNIVNKLK
mgnify:FL=1